MHRKQLKLADSKGMLIFDISLNTRKDLVQQNARARPNANNNFNNFVKLLDNTAVML